MPPLDKPRHETFAQLAAAGASLVEAYESAGYSAHRQNAHRLMTKDAVNQRVAEIQQGGVELAQITVASLVARADELRELAIKHAQISAGVAAVKEMGILTGLRIDRREVGSPGEFDRMTEAELLKFIEGEVIDLTPIPDET